MTDDEIRAAGIKIFAPSRRDELCPDCGAETQFNAFAGGLYRCVSTTCGKFILAKDLIVSHPYLVREKWHYNDVGDPLDYDPTWYPDFKKEEAA